MKNQDEIEKLARDVLLLSRNTLLVNLRFLDAALSQFEWVSYEGGSFATTGKFLFYDPVYVLKRYRKEKEIPVRDYLHIVMHCILQHMYGAPNLNRRIWDLACDIAVENAILDLGLRCVSCSRDQDEERVLKALRSELGVMTAEKIYRFYMDLKLLDEQIDDLRKVFYTDDHEPWYWTVEQLQRALGRSGNSGEDGKSGEPDSSDNRDESQGNQNGSSAGKGCSGESQSDPDEGFSEEYKTQQEIWEDISKHIQTDLNSFSKMRGNQAGCLVQNLMEVNREKYDYTAFLKKFAVMGEVMKINDEEFDYLFYTYGLQLYKNMPLIEPLEYKEVKRIREFVIAIDTSGSTSGELVQLFLQKTYNILKSTESFFTKINLHVIQCDADIQEHVKISSQEEFDEYLKTMKILGLGGTDFRPVFDLVDELVMKHEFTNLKGLIYFTDGYGVFPVMKPGYETAFVFIDDGQNNLEVPSWAIKLILRKEEI